MYKSQDLRAIEPLWVNEVAASSNTGKPRLLNRSSSDDEPSRSRHGSDADSGCSSGGEQALTPLAAGQEGRAEAIKDSSRCCSHVCVGEKEGGREMEGCRNNTMREGGVSKEGLCMEPGRISAIWRRNLDVLVDRFRTNEMESSISISASQPPTWTLSLPLLISKLSYLQMPFSLILTKYNSI